MLPIYSLSYIINPNITIMYSSININVIIVSILSIILYKFGLTLPDIDLKLKYFYSGKERSERFRYHRQFTHSILLTAILTYISIYQIDNVYMSTLLFSLTLGIITHQIGDILTGSIPILFYGPYYVRFSRFGITIILPKFLHKYFTKKLPLWFDKNPLFFIILFLVNLTISIIYFF